MATASRRKNRKLYMMSFGLFVRGLKPKAKQQTKLAAINTIQVYFVRFQSLSIQSPVLYQKQANKVKWIMGGTQYISLLLFSSQIYFSQHRYLSITITGLMHTNHHPLHLKRHCQSLPSIHSPLRALPFFIQNARTQVSSTQSSLEKDKQTKQLLDVQQDINAKMKVLAGRNIKKLEERYETIDRWKKKYISEGSNIFSKHQHVVHGVPITITRLKQSNEHSIQEKLQNNTTLSRIKHSLLPSLSKNYLHSMIAYEQIKKIKFQALIKQKILGNNKYYESKSIKRQKIKLQNFHTIIPPERSREIELNNFVSKKSISKSGLINTKMILSQPSRKTRLDTLQDYKTIQRKMIVKERDSVKLNGKQDISLKKLREFKQKQMGEILEEGPQGWNTAFYKGEIDEDYMV